MRWSSQEVKTDSELRLPGVDGAIIRRFDAPEALDIRFHEVRTKSALNRVPGGARLPFGWTVNPYRGCTHACVYCFARPTHEYLDMDAGRDFEREIIVKVNVPEVLRAELGRPSWTKEHIALGTNTDPYQWVEGRYKLMRGIWEALRDAANPCSILTKSPLVLRDLDLLKEIRQVTSVEACLSVPTLEEKAWRATEPHTPHPKARLEAVAELNRNGIPTGILIAPLMPGINDDPAQVAKIVEAAEEAKATYIGGNTLFLRPAVRKLVFEFLQAQRPELVPRYERLYENGRVYLAPKDRRRVELDAGAPWIAKDESPFGPDRRFRRAPRVQPAPAPRPVVANHQQRSLF
jgi:DNA repair photolyase